MPRGKWAKSTVALKNSCSPERCPLLITQFYSSGFPCALCTGQSGPRERAHPLWIRTVQSIVLNRATTLQVPCSYSCNVDTNDLVGSYTMAPHTGHFSHEYHVKGVHTHAVHMYTQVGNVDVWGELNFWLFILQCDMLHSWTMNVSVTFSLHLRLMNNDAMFLLLCTTRYTSYCVCVYATCVYGSHDTQHVRHAAVWDL